MKWEVAPERIARVKRCVPKGKITKAPLPPLKGETIQPLSVADLGLRERKAA